MRGQTPERSRTIRVLLGDAQSLFREAVRTALDNTAGIDVVGEAEDGLSAVAEAGRTHPDIALLEARLPGSNAVEITPMIKERAGCRVIVVTSEDDQEVLIDALDAGADGYVTKGAPLAELIEGIFAVQAGEILVPPRMLGDLITQLTGRRRHENQARRLLDRLTRREREVLALLADGADNLGIARALVISPQTARTHVQHVLEKLEVHSRLEAAAFVMRNGVLKDLVGANP